MPPGLTARTLSPSCTEMCLPRGIRYSFVSLIGTDHDLAHTFHEAGEFHGAVYLRDRGVLRGFRASNSSATRGRPPVMSLVLVDSRGILARMSPWKTSAPSLRSKCAPTGSM